jgi:SAM-dependent methyltransferase
MSQLPPDVADHRAWLISLTHLPPGGAALDLGCGRGEDAQLLAERHPEAAQIIGVDSSDESLTEAANSVRDPRVSFRRESLNGRLPFDDESADLVYSNNLLECLSDPDGFAREVARILRPGGQAVIAHWDWDSQLFDGNDKALMRRLVAAYADWQQAWMSHSDGWMGRRLWGVFNGIGCFAGSVHARVLTNTVYEEPWLGYQTARAIRSLVKRGLATADDYDRFERDQAELNALGRYFYGITGFAYVGRKTTD